METAISDLGLPDVDRDYPPELKRANFCPAETVRLVEYRRKSLWLLRFIGDEGEEAVLCVAVDGRVLKVLSSP